jgi:hypothetical protein
LLAFFRAAVDSPPDVEYFLATKHTLRDRRKGGVAAGPIQPRQLFEGGRSGTNFFLRELTTTNGVDWAGDVRSVVGRQGLKTYYLNANALVYSYDHPETTSRDFVAGLGEAFYIMVNQFLNMGLPDVQPGTVVWDGLDFSARRAAEVPVFGHLELSNAAPRRLLLSAVKDGDPFMAIDYSYPDPPFKLSGFPTKVTISSLSSNGLLPFMEIGILKVKLASAPISESFFGEGKFITRNILHTNFFSGEVLMTTLPGGKVVKAPLPVHQK